jgi:dTDP-4-amino-4,6-dideoxygalactose transaminase
MKDLPALLGNKPVFENRISIARPVVPPFEELAAELESIFASGVLTKGPLVRRFEETVAERLGAKHAIAVSSCTSGLMLTYQALGVTGDVVVPSFTFMATVSALVWAGARPIFADVNVATANLDPRAAETAITPETTAIVAAHSFGNPADIEELISVAERHKLRLIFDAAHAVGSLYKETPCAQFGDAHVFSLTPTKLVVAGEGGIVATNNGEVAEKIRVAREYGNPGDYDSAFAGMNARMPEINALLAQHSLNGLESAVQQRNQIAAFYQERLSNLPGLGFQQVRAMNRSTYNDFSIIVESDAFGLSRDELAGALAAENVDTRKYYDPPVHRQTAYSKFAPPKEALPNTDLLSSRILHLPIWSDMNVEIAAGVCQAVERSHECAAMIAEARREAAHA